MGNSVDPYYQLRKQKTSKETTEATYEAITQEATRMKIGILFLLFARSCLSDPLPLSRVCPKGWLQNGLGHCFLFGSAGIGSWAEAKEYCKEKGGFLAEIPNEQINSYLYDNIKTNSNLQKKWWWIGANDIANEGQFSWDNSGASLGFDDFNKLNRQDDLQRVGGQGGKNCVALNCKNQNNCFWNNIPCNGNKGGYPLCEIDTTQTGCGNTHLNNLLESTSTDHADGWTIDCKKGVWTKHDKNCHNWYGWSPKGSLTEGSITTTFSGSGRARLDFGNCNFKGIVKAFLDGQEIASAIPKSALIPHKVVDFNFHPGSKLTIREDETGVIQFNSLAVIGCGEPRNGED